jgi:hypothetical protein
MGIESIKLGPKSRMVDDLVESAAKKAYDATVAAVKTEQVGPRPSDAAVAEAAGLIGCACGKELLRSRGATLEVNGIVHRHGKRCLSVGSLLRVDLPREGKVDVIYKVVEQLMERRRFGVTVRGKPPQVFDGRDAFKGHIDGLLDATAYAEQVQLEHQAVVTALCAMARYVRENHERTGVVEAALGLAAALERIP